jgi:hypothetical protein
LGGLKLSDSGDARTESSKKRRHWNMLRWVSGILSKIRLEGGSLGVFNQAINMDHGHLL